MPLESTAQRLEEHRCRACARLLFKVDVEHAIVQTVCPDKRCRRYQHLDLKAEVAPRLRRVVKPELMSPDALVELMEQRWDALIKSRALYRAEVAVGLRFMVFKRDEFRCRYCGIGARDGAILHADHVIPRSKGGLTALENLVTACIDCNLGKSDKDIDGIPVLR